MKIKTFLIKIFVVLGMISVFFPIFFSLLTGIIGTIRDKAFRFDFLIPLELFIFIILGGVLLTYVAYKQRKRFGLTLTELISAVVTLALSQLIAVVSGLAADKSGKPAYIWAIIAILIISYWVCCIGLIISGIRLAREIFVKKHNNLN